ncbi:MAG TPA: anti-sigma factor [Vicinamibacterales bacterium]|nr:anti-sigma factor [Vicinamibacterales bacterium]
MMAHEAFEDALASYAIDALDPPDARAFEAHLSSCARCQAELAELRRVVAGIGMTAEPMTPPVALKARTLANATGQPDAAFLRRAAPVPPAQTLPFPPSRASARPSPMPWLVAAAAVVAAMVSGMYAWSLRSRISSLEQMVTVSSAQADRLREDLISLRRDSANLIQTVRVISAPDVQQVVMKGQPGAEGATGRAYWSPSRGLVFNAEQLPALTPGRVYQLWVIAGKTPIGVGTFGPTNGSGSLTVPLPPGVTAINAVAVTNEPAGGSQTPTPPILLIGTN